MILIDINVLLDVVQKREPFYRASAAVLDRVVRGQVSGSIAAHAVTTVHYLVARYQNREIADKVVEWLLRFCSIAPIGHKELLRAQGLKWSDFEDAVVAMAAESSGCHVIVTRNVTDFKGSPVIALTPDEYLLESGTV